MSISIDNKIVGHHRTQFCFKIQNPRTARNKSIFNKGYRLDHEQSLLLIVKGCPPFQVKNCSIRAKRNVDVAILSSSTEELNMSAVEHIKTTTYKYFFSHRDIRSSFQCCEYFIGFGSNMFFWYRTEMQCSTNCRECLSIILHSSTIQEDHGTFSTQQVFAFVHRQLWPAALRAAPLPNHGRADKLSWLITTRIKP